MKEKLTTVNPGDDTYRAHGKQDVTDSRSFEEPSHLNEELRLCSSLLLSLFLAWAHLEIAQVLV